MENQIDFPKENQMEKYGMWYNREVYKITREEYIRHKYYEPDASCAFWIIDDKNYLVVDNIIKGRVMVSPNKVSVDDSVREVGTTYYYRIVKNIFESIAEEKNSSEARSAVDEVLAGVYTAKLWDEI